MEPDIIDHGDYIELKVQQSDKNTQIEQFKKFSVDAFFDLAELPTDYEYSNYFKQRLHQLAIAGEIRVESLSCYLNNVRNGKTNALRDHENGCGFLTRNGLSRYKILHHHIDSYNHTDTYLHQLNIYLKKNKVKHDGLKEAIKIFQRNQRDYRTGNWVLYTKINNKRYYLDVCLHGDDSYIHEIGIHEYLKELPNLLS